MSKTMEPTQTSPLAVIMASIVPIQICIYKPEGLCLELGKERFTLIDRNIESVVVERQVTDVHHEPWSSRPFRLRIIMTY